MTRRGSLSALALLGAAALLPTHANTPHRLLTRSDLDRVLSVSFAENGALKTVRIDDRYEIAFEDKDGDGKPDAFELRENGALKVRRWYRSPSGPPNGGTFYRADGTEETVSWGSYREQEAAKNKRKMDQERRHP